MALQEAFCFSRPVEGIWGDLPNPLCELPESDSTLPHVHSGWEMGCGGGRGGGGGEATITKSLHGVLADNLVY